MKTTMQEITMDEALVIAIMRKAILCEVCGETRGGAIGNGQVVDGVVMCDMCHADYMRAYEVRAVNDGG
jgi:hypothetical protein